MSRKSIIETKADKPKSPLFATREQAVAAGKGCTGVRIVLVNGTQMFAPCPPNANGFEKLGERGVAGIETLPDGGLVSAKDDDIVEIDEKGFVSNYSRSTDPDVFSDPDSARVRARNLGCIGIRSYIAKDGKKVYLPCTNSADYNKYTGLRHDGAPMKKKSAMNRVGKRKMRTVLGKPTKPSVPKEIDIDSQTVNTLAMKVRQHNSGVTNKPNWAHTNLRVLKDVYTRGNKEGKGFARVNEFLKLVRSGTADSGYHKDDDLLDSNHPWLKKPSGKK